jgi:type I site-specific restriction endonuclease
MKLNLAAIGSIIQSFFDRQKVQQTARETKFVRRVSELTGGIFLQAMVFTFHWPETFAERLKQTQSLRGRLLDLPTLPTAGLRACQINAITRLE